MSAESSYLVVPSDTGPSCFWRRYLYGAHRPSRAHLNLTGLRLRYPLEEGGDAFFDREKGLTVFLRWRERGVAPGVLGGDVFADLADVQPMMVPQRTRERS